MNPLIPTLEFSLPRGTNLTNDVEVLQTDVMRFFAILALCLMAIFALVKALPMAPAADQTVLPPLNNLRAEGQSLQKQIALLKEKLARIQIQVNTATTAARQSSSRATKAANDEQAVRKRLIKTQQELQNTSQSLSKTRVDLKNREAALAKILDDIDRKQERYSELKSQIEDGAHKLNALQAALSKTQEKMYRRPQQKQPPAKKLSEQLPTGKIEQRPTKTILDSSPAPQPKSKGFTLRFASDAALQELIAKGEVNFFALTGKKAWQLRLSAGQMIFSPVESPREIYEMESSTVPHKYSEAFRKNVVAYKRSSITWGVTLPAQTSASVRRLIAGRNGGDLLIMPDGEVIIN